MTIAELYTWFEELSIGDARELANEDAGVWTPYSDSNTDRSEDWDEVVSDIEAMSEEDYEEFAATINADSSYPVLGGVRPSGTYIRK